MPPSPLPQGLLNRAPHLSRAQFSDHYFKNHAAIVAPFFLSIGIKDYVQVHAPFTLVNENAILDVELEYWDAVALILPGDLSNLFGDLPQWKQDYYHSIILVDERRFLISNAIDHLHIIPANSVTGVKKVVIRDGACVIDVQNALPPLHCRA